MNKYPKSQESQISQRSQRSHIMEGSQAIAETVRLCRPGVVCAYPITPQTHIVEELANIKANEKVGYEYVRADSELAVASIVLGASQAGVRTYTASASQGLLLMTEILYNIAGLRLPVVMTCANRAVSAPINIWNDQQDAFSVRDAGWIMLFASDLQEAVDMHILAYRVAELVSLPVMVNVDGFNITHVTEPVEVPKQSDVNKFLPEYKPVNFLDVDNPKTFGMLGTPDYYYDVRMDLHKKVQSSKFNVESSMKDFKQIFGRKLNILNQYKIKDADIVLVSTGSIVGTLKVAIDELRSEKIKVGILDISLFRPFPEKEIAKVLGDKKKIIVLNQAISLGKEGILTTEIKSVLCNNFKGRIYDEVVGLGGKDVRVEDIVDLVKS